MTERVRRAASGPRARIAVSVALVIVASAMILVIVLPATTWQSPEVDATYSGFDPVLMYHDPTGSGQAAGSVVMKPDSLTIAALPGSAPVVHLSTSTLSTSSTLRATIVEAQAGSRPLVVAVWSAYNDYRYQVVFESEPSRRVVMQRTHQGSVLEEVPLGVYTIGQQYAIETTIDRQKGVVSIAVSPGNRESYVGNALYIATTNAPFESHVISEPVAVLPGVEYTLTSIIKPITAGLAGQSVEWLDSAGSRISVQSQWEPIGEAPVAWAGRDFPVVAPAEAASARIELATASGGAAMFGDVVFASDAQPSRNLLPNGSLIDGAAGWRRAEGSAPLEVRQFAKDQFLGSINAAAWPELFASARLALTVQSTSASGLSSVRLTDYQVSLPHQRWLAVKVDDPRLDSLLNLLGVGGLLLVAGWLTVKAPAGISRVRAAVMGLRTSWEFGSPGVLVLVAAVVGLFAVGNAFLSHLGSLNADIIGARVWGYVSANFGPADLYYLPNIASAEAVQWNGLPLQEAGFPYGPVMAYITWVQGIIYSTFLAPLAGVATGVEFDALARFTNAVFAVADAVMIFLIGRRMGGSPKVSGVIAAVFLLNPAIWFAGSVWGTSQSVSLLFLLSAVYFTERRIPALAWGFLFLAMMTRPQNLIPGALLAIYLLRDFPIRRTVLAIAKATVVAFLLLLPFAWAISPTLPFDTIFNALFLHVGTGNDLWTLPLSWGGMSIWPLLAPLFAPLDGVDRLLYPATTPVLGSLGPYQIGTAALALFLTGLALVLVRRRASIRQRDYTLILAVGAMALFMLPTSVPSYHFILALGLVMLTRRSLPRWAYVMSVTVLTATTFLSMYTMGAYWLSVHPVWGVGVYDPASPLTQLAVALVLSDAFITALTGANLLVFLVLCRYTLWPVALAQAAASPEQLDAEPVGDPARWSPSEPAMPATLSSARSAPK